MRSKPVRDKGETKHLDLIRPAGEHDGELGDDVEDVDDDLVDGARLLVEDAAEERLVQVADVRLVQRVHGVHLLRVADLRLQEGKRSQFLVMHWSFEWIDLALFIQRTRALLLQHDKMNCCFKNSFVSSYSSLGSYDSVGELRGLFKL